MLEKRVSYQREVGTSILAIEAIYTEALCNLHSLTVEFFYDGTAFISLF